MNMINGLKDRYFVAVKVFLEKYGDLLIIKDGFGQWDLPGGRLLASEFAVPFEDVVRRKFIEELGNNFEYQLGKPVIYFRHERVEAVPVNPKVRIFALGYRATYVKDNISLTSHHKEHIWVDPQNFTPETYFTGGWLNGVKEYIQLRKKIIVPTSFNALHNSD